MDEAGAGQFPQRGIESQQRVLQGMVGIARPWVHDQTGRLVDHQQVGVFVGKSQRDRLRLHRGLRFLSPHLDLYAAAGCNEIAGLQTPSADQNRARLDPAFDSRARMLRQQARQGAVQPMACQLRRYYKIDHLELCTHRGLEATGGASGILPRFRAQPTGRLL